MDIKDPVRKEHSLWQNLPRLSVEVRERKLFPDYGKKEIKTESIKEDGRSEMI